jgi:hypothetical protein
MLGSIDLTEMKTEGRCGEKREILAENKKNAGHVAYLTLYDTFTPISTSFISAQHNPFPKP